MRRKLFCLFTLLIVYSTAFAQPPDTLWTRTFGGGGVDKGNGFTQASDGGFVITGSTTSYGIGASDVYLIKTDSNGNYQWQRTYGSMNSDEGYCVNQTSDGGYIIVGNAHFQSNNDVYLIKTDILGDTAWTKTYGWTIYNSYGYEVRQTSDGGYIIVGATNQFGVGNFDVYLIKTNELGDTTWTRTFGGNEHDYGYSVYQTSDGGYIISGNTYSYGAGNSDVYIIKTDSNGDTVWTTTFGGTDNDGGNCVIQSAGGEFVIAGGSASGVVHNYQVYLIKIDANGDSLWTRKYGGDQGEGGNDIFETSDGGYIVTGNTYSYGAGEEDVYIIKTV